MKLQLVYSAQVDTIEKWMITDRRVYEYISNKLQNMYYYKEYKNQTRTTNKVHPLIMFLRKFIENHKHNRYKLIEDITEHLRKENNAHSCHIHRNHNTYDVCLVLIYNVILENLAEINSITNTYFENNKHSAEELIKNKIQRIIQEKAVEV